MFQDKSKVVWVRQNDFKHPKTALYLPENYHKEGMWETHDSIFGGHNTTQKMYLKILPPTMGQRCFKPSKSMPNSASDLNNRKSQNTKRFHFCAMLPIPEQPNMRINADLFCAMMTADSNKIFGLCITYAFTKYAVVTAIANKEAEIVTDGIY